MSKLCGKYEVIGRSINGSPVHYFLFGNAELRADEVGGIEDEGRPDGKLTVHPRMLGKTRYVEPLRRSAVPPLGEWMFQPSSR